MSSPTTVGQRRAECRMTTAERNRAWLFSLTSQAARKVLNPSYAARVVLKRPARAAVIVLYLSVSACAAGGCAKTSGVLLERECVESSCADASDGTLDAAHDAAAVAGSCTSVMAEASTGERVPACCTLGTGDADYVSPALVFLNQKRAEAGVGPLTRDPALELVAQAFVIQWESRDTTTWAFDALGTLDDRAAQCGTTAVYELLLDDPGYDEALPAEPAEQYVSAALSQPEAAAAFLDGRNSRVAMGHFHGYVSLVVGE